MTTSTTLSVAAADAAWRTDRLYLYGTDTIVAPRDTLVPRALARLGIGAGLHQGLVPCGDERSTEVALDASVIQRIRFLRVMPLIYVWRFEDATLVMPVRPGGLYHVESFRGEGAEAAGRTRGLALSLQHGLAVTFRSPRARCWPGRRAI